MPGEVVPPATADGIASEVDAFASRLADQDFFSGAVLLARHGEPILHEAYGLAERRFRVPNSVDTRFYSASVTKTFTAIAIARLVEQRRVAWDDPLERFIPGFPDAESAAAIRIEHLLSHTSGLGDVFAEGTVVAPDAYRNVADFMATAPTRPPAFRPGTAFRYSNLGFLVLGRVIEVAAGADYYDFVAEHVFRPAGMASAGMDPIDEVPDRLAYGYDPGDPLEPEPSYRDNAHELRGRSAPFGGAYLTAMDLLRFDRALRSGALLSPGTWRVVRAPRPELGAPEGSYGFELRQFGTVTGRRCIGHGGNTLGASASWGTIEDAADEYTFVVLCNSGVFACFPVNDHIFAMIPSAERLDTAAGTGPEA